MLFGEAPSIRRLLGELRLEEHDVHAPDGIEISESVHQFPDACCGALAEERLETPFPVVHVLCGADNVLELVLDRMEVANDECVLVIERKRCDCRTFQPFEFCVTLDVFVYRLADGTGA